MFNRRPSPATPHHLFAVLSTVLVHQAGGGNNNDKRHDGNHQGNYPTMGTKTTKKGAAATTKKPPVGMKTTSKDEADLVVSRPVSMLYGFGTNDKYAMSFNTEGHDQLLPRVLLCQQRTPSNGGVCCDAVR